MEMAPRALLRPGRVPQQRLSDPRISLLVVAVLRRFSWISSGCPRVFGSEASYRRRNQGRWGSRGATPPLGASRACPCLGGCGHPVAPLRHCFVVPCCSGKIITLAFVPSNSENIDFLP